MENFPWRIALFTAFLALAVAAVLRRRRSSPPGPLSFPLLGNLIWLTSKSAEFQTIINNLSSTYGPLTKIQLWSLPLIMVSDPDLAHEMLVRHGSIFADRPARAVFGTLAEDHEVIANGHYNSRWRLLRRNLTTEILNPSRVKNMEDTRQWALQILLDEIRSQAENKNGVVVIREAFRYAIFSLLIFFCFGEKMEGSIIRDIESARRDLLGFFQKIMLLEFTPKFARFLFWGKWKTLLKLLRRQKEILLPLIRSRREQKESRVLDSVSYLDSLLDLEISEENGEKKKLSDEEIMYLCAEFIDAGTEPTYTSLEWIMANLVRNPSLQEKLAQDLGSREIDQPYLKAVVLEGLRRHPPGQLLISHAAMEDTSVGGYTIPKGMSINYGVAIVNWNEKIWRDPMEFKPERFLPGGEGEEIDVTGSKKIQMLTFGAGRRICPGMNLALVHLEFFIGNLVRRFRWEAVGEVDMAEKNEFTVKMETPVSARISPRF